MKRGINSFPHPPIVPLWSNILEMETQQEAHYWNVFSNIRSPTGYVFLGLRDHLFPGDAPNLRLHDIARPISPNKSGLVGW